jgi:hypothetical protein
MMMLAYNLFLLFIFDFPCISEYRQQIKTFHLKYVFLAAKIIKTARYVIMKLSEKYPYQEVYEKCLSREGGIEYSGFGFSVFDGICLPYQSFYFTKNIRRIQDKVVLKMLQYRKYFQNSSPIGSKWRRFYVDVKFR